jgi:hypothetical protein
VVVGLLAVQPPRPGGYLVVGANAPPAESERFLLQVLAQQAAEAELRAAALG